jgi:transposase
MVDREATMLWRRGKSYGQDLRERVFAAADIGTPVGEIAEMLLVSISYVSKALSRRARTGEPTSRRDIAVRSAI